jgi:hypothetical protein
MKVSTPLFAIIAIVTCSSWPLAATAQTLSDRMLVTGHNTTLTRPVTNVKAIVEEVGRATRAAVGLEQVPALPLPPRVVRKRTVESQTPLAGKRIGEILDLLVNADPRYTWRDRGSIIEIAPKDLVDSDPLNIIIADFTLDNATVDAALVALHRVFDPAYSGPTGVVHTGIRPSLDAEAQGTRPFTVHLHNSRLREVLNAIAVAHGDLMWFVGFTQAPAAVEHMTLEFVTFDGWSRGTHF